jgi:hypothetical protein
MNFRYVLSPSKLKPLTEKFIDSLVRYPIKGVSLKNMGMDINSDFDGKNLMDRQQALAVNTECLETVREHGLDVLLDGVNAPLLAETKRILNMPMDSSQFNVTDESIPFYQMVIHGFIEYAGEPINLAQDYRRNILKSIETGAGIYYVWMYQSNDILKNTDYYNWYSIYYGDWLDDAKSLYAEFNEMLQDVQNQRMVNHEKLQENVFQTTFENGKSIIVNYNKKPVNL